MNKEYAKICCEESMKWHGWGSPVGLGLFFVGVGICAVLIRFAIVGF